MSIQRDMPDIDKALNESSWDWLRSENEPLAKAVQREVKRGTPPKTIHDHILEHAGYHRVALARRVKQAAEHLQGCFE